jgi:hypothetical protein
LAVVGASVGWIVQGAYSISVWLTWILTLPWSYFAEGVAAIAAMVLFGSPFGEGVVTLLILVLFPGAAIGNVLLVRAAWQTCRRRRLRRKTAPLPEWSGPLTVPEWAA